MTGYDNATEMEYKFYTTASAAYPTCISDMTNKKAPSKKEFT